MSDIKKLKKLYEEYKKIGTSDGGKVEYDKKNLKELNKSFGKFLKEESNEKGYDKGGEVAESSPSISQDLIDAFKKTFGAKPSPTPQPDSLDEKYQKIRAQNRSNFSGEPSEAYNKGGKVKGYYDGEEVTSDDSSKSLSPEEFQAHLDDLKAQGKTLVGDQGDPQYINAQLNSDQDEGPVASEDLEEEKKPEDKELEDKMADEDFEAKEKVEPKEEAKEDNKEDEREPASKDEESDKEEEDKSDEEKDQEEDQKASEETPDSSNVAKLIERMKQGSPDLREAQKQRDLNVALQQIQRGGALFGAGAARSNPTQALQTINENDKFTNIPVQKYGELIQDQQNDPNSPMSQVVKQYAATKGIKLPDNTSAADFFKVAPFYQKDTALQSAIQKVLLQQGGAQKRAELSNTTRSDIAEKNRIAALERTKVGNQGKIAAAKAGQEAKMGKEQRDAQVKAENDLNSTRGKQALMMAQKNLLSVKNAQAMLQEFPDTNKWTPQQVQLFNSEIAKIAQGGAPTEGQIHELSNPTAASNLANFTQKLTNVPVGADQGKFIALNKKYLEGLGDVSHQVIKDNVGNVVKSYEDKLGPEAYKNILYRHSDMLGLYSPSEERGINAVMSTKGLSRQDAIKALVQQKLIKDVNY